jgi:hypothetical protein
MHHAAIFAELAILGEEIIDRYLAHFRHYRFCFVGASGLNSAQIVARGGVHGGLGRAEVGIRLWMAKKRFDQPRLSSSRSQ